MEESVDSSDLKSLAARHASSTLASGTNMYFSEPNQGFADKFFELALQASRIGITSHVAPDDDSIAAVLASYWLLSQKYPDKIVRIIYTGEFTDRLSMFKNFDKVEFVQDISDHFKDIDLLLVLDCSQYNRFTQFPEKLSSFNGKTICIDHHSSPQDKFDLTLIAPRASSTAELLYLTFYKDKKVEKLLAEILMLGILGDTGNFSYLRKHNLSTLETAKNLLEQGEIEIDEFQSRYRTIPVKILEIIGELIKNTKYYSIEGWPDFSTAFISREFVKENKYDENEVSQAKHVYMRQYLKRIKGYPWGFVVEPDPNGDCGISFRSLPGSVNVRDVSERMELGGGHDRAAGGTFKRGEQGELSVGECMDSVINWLRSNKH